MQDSGQFFSPGSEEIPMDYIEYSLLMKDLQPAELGADELLGYRASSRAESSFSSSFFPNLSWTPPGAVDPLLDVVDALDAVDALGDLNNAAPNEACT